MLDFVQQLVSGFVAGSVYALIAPEFVLICKATAITNFAQGDLVMLGRVVAYTSIVILGMNYRRSALCAVLAMGLVGVLIERFVVRPIFGYPAFSIVMATISPGISASTLAQRLFGDASSRRDVGRRSRLACRTEIFDT